MEDLFLTLTNELDRLEKDITVLLNLTTNDADSGHFATACLDTIRRRLNTISWCAVQLSVNSDQVSGETVKGSEVVASCLSAMLTKLFYNVVASNNSNFQVALSVIERLNMNEGIHNELDQLSRIVSRIKK